MAASLLLAGSAAVSPAGEPAQAFLAGLRDRGLHDVALDYLDLMADSPLAPQDWKETIPLEKAATLIASARQQREAAAAVAQLDEAQAQLQQFIAAHASHPRCNGARNQLGSLIFERARRMVSQPPQGKGDQSRLEARKLYQQAFDVFGQLRSSVAAELDQIPKVLDTRDRKQAALAEKRKQLRADNLQTELLAAAILEESAETYPAGSESQREVLLEAAKLYDSIYKNYRGRLAGFYARLYQGRCNQRLGKLRDALGYYTELLEQPNESSGMFDLKTKTLRMAMECWLAPSQKKYLESIRRGSTWIELAPANRDRESDWLAIRLRLAEAYRMQADAAKKLEPPDQRAARLSLDAALTHATFVAGEPGDLQQEALALVAALGGESDTPVDLPPQTFAEARAEGKDALDRLPDANRAVTTAERKLSERSGDAALLRQLNQARAELQIATREAFEGFRLALELADRDTPRSEVNLVRYFLCYLHYLQQQHYDAALLGDFVFRRYPESAAAKQCAKISMACYLTLFVKAEGSDRRFETDRLVGVTEQIADQWPDEAMAEESLATVIPHLVNAGELSAAKRLTQRIDPASPRRGAAELVTGQAHWSAAIRQSATSAEGSAEPSTGLQATAVELLTAGFERLPDDPAVTASDATALLSLARALVVQGDYAKSWEVLTHPQIGPLTLVDGKRTEVAQAGFAEETYRTALEALIGTVADEGETRLEETKRVMTALQEVVADDNDGQTRLLSVYARLALNIETQLKSASPESKAKLSAVFENLLGELSHQATDPGVLSWVAETLAGIGAGLDEGDAALQLQASRYYQQSIDAFRNLLADESLPAPTAIQFRVRLSEVIAKTGDHATAFAELKRVLDDAPTAVNVQVAAAARLQAWGRETPSKYAVAIAGEAPPSPVWGWAKIASATQNHPAFRDTFYQARYETANCQLAQSKTVSGDAKARLLAQAHRVLVTTRQLYPTLGGPDGLRRYDALINQILVAQGKPPIEPISITVPQE